MDEGCSSWFDGSRDANGTVARCEERWYPDEHASAVMPVQTNEFAFDPAVLRGLAEAARSIPVNSAQSGTLLDNYMRFKAHRIEQGRPLPDPQRLPRMLHVYFDRDTAEREGCGVFAKATGERVLVTHMNEEETAHVVPGMYVGEVTHFVHEWTCEEMFPYDSGRHMLSVQQQQQSLTFAPDAAMAEPVQKGQSNAELLFKQQLGKRKRRA